MGPLWAFYGRRLFKLPLLVIPKDKPQWANSLEGPTYQARRRPLVEIQKFP